MITQSQLLKLITTKKLLPSNTEIPYWIQMEILNDEFDKELKLLERQLKSFP